MHPRRNSRLLENLPAAKWQYPLGLHSSVLVSEDAMKDLGFFWQPAGHNTSDFRERRICHWQNKLSAFHISQEAVPRSSEPQSLAFLLGLLHPG